MPSCGPSELLGHPAHLAGAVEDGEIELLVGGVERGEEIEDLVDDFGHARVRPVDLVDRDDRLQADLQRLADDEFGLRHRPFRGIDEDDGAVHHGEDALHLAAEIGVAGRIDDIDARILPGDRGHLGHDGDAALLFEIVGIHHALGDALIFAEGAGLLKQAVDQGRFAVVDMGDNGDIAQVHWNLKSSVQRACRAAAGSRMGMTAVSRRGFATERPPHPTYGGPLSRLQHPLYELN